MDLSFDIFKYPGIGKSGYFCKGFYLICNFGYRYLACKPIDKPDDPLLAPPLLEFCTDAIYGKQFLNRLHQWKNPYEIISDLTCYLLGDEHSLSRFNKAQAIDYIANKMQRGQLQIILLDEPKTTWTTIDRDNSADSSNSNSSGIVLEQGSPVPAAKTAVPTFNTPANSNTKQNAASSKSVSAAKPQPKYGGKATPDGGRDSTQAFVYKDPATKHLDDDPSRKPVYDNGVMQPLAGTAGKAKPIPKRDEAGAVAKRIKKRSIYQLNKDENGMPEFTIFETYLGDEHINSCDSDAHFKAANKRLGELLIDNPNLSNELGLTDNQYKQLTKKPPAAKSPDYLTWHHHQDTGKMQLVDEDLHKRFGHIGGMERWGGGRKA